MDANNAMAFTILAPAGIKLPQASLAPDAPTLTVAFVEAAAGDLLDIPAHAIAQSPAAGLYATSLSYMPAATSAATGTATKVTVRFTNSRTASMGAGDHVQVELAGFGGDSDTDLNDPDTQRLQNHQRRCG